MAVLLLLVLPGAATSDRDPTQLAATDQWRGGTSETVNADRDRIAEAKLLAATAPAEILALPADRARAVNARIPFSKAPNPPARPFVLGGDEESRARAMDCLAAAQYYEAGADFEGQRAVAQVVLNRVRHPAYPDTVCAVVFEGAERRTGCQFTFTCDGAMRREPIAWAWSRTRAIAREALNGSVYAKVGLSTHYHTDWVVPVWSGRLDKVTEINTHLFFRWPGGWGQPRAFSAKPSANEPVIGRLARLSASHRPAEEGEDSAPLTDAELAQDPDSASARRARAASLPPLPGVNLRGGQLRLAHPAGGAYGFLLPTDLPRSYGLLAYDVCKGRDFCKVMGWNEADEIPRGFPISFAAQQEMAFLYVYDRANKREIMAWDCTRFPDVAPDACLSSDLTRWDAGTP